MAAAMAAATAAALAGCGDRRQTNTVTLRLATTTSTDNSGLLGALLPAFEKRHCIKVHVIAVGTGKAIKHGENGDVDVILVHARAAEDKFVEDGHGVNRRDVMHNDFVILGPEADPAGVRGMTDAKAAFKKIADAQALFVSRGDDSGTHKKEKRLWAAAGVSPAGAWYMAAGQGMGACLNIAHEKQGYVVSDRGTYLAYEDKISSKVLVEGGPLLYNPYGVIAVNPKRHPHAKFDAASTFIEWLVSAEAQEIIAGFTRGGEQLFYPDALPGK